MEKNTPKVSIIVPVYNRQDQIGSCLKSISLQKYSNYEVLIVDDGSVDATSRICSNYIKKDKRFKYYYQDNKGVSAARNKGLKEAHGEWVTFVDSDDAITADHLSVLEELNYNKSNYCLIMTSHGGGMIKGDEFVPYTKLKNEHVVHKEGNRDIVNYLFGEFDPIKNPVYPIWNKFFKRSVIKEFNLSFHEDISLGEDQVFVMEYLIHTQELFWINRISYLSMHWTGISHLGGILRSPDNFWYNQLANYNSLMSVAESANSDLAKQYAINYLFDRPITHILFRYTEHKNIRLCPRNVIIAFFRQNIRPFFISQEFYLGYIHDKWVYRIAYLIIKNKMYIAYYSCCLYNILKDLKLACKKVYWMCKSFIKKMIR